MTARTAILSALVRACGEDLSTQFTRSEICVLAWKMSPEKFSMRGHPAYPDAKRIDCELSNMCRTATSHYVPQKPMLERVGTNLYRLTSAGLDAGRILEASTRKGAA